MPNSSEKAGKIRTFFHEVRTHWKTPPEGKYVPYREYKDIFLSVGFNYTGNKLLEYIVFAASCYLMMYHYKLPYLTYSIINIINMPLNYIWTMMTWYIADNLGFMPKKNERKLYGVYFALIVIGLGLIVLNPAALFNPASGFVRYINSLEGINLSSAFKILGTHILWNGWFGARNIFWRKKLIPKYGRYKYSLYCNAIPKCVMVILIGWLPFYNIPDVITRVWVANLMFAIYNLFPFDNTLEVCAQNISPDVRERIWVRTIPIKLSHFIHSILSILLPVFIGMLRYKWEDINLFKWILPGFFVTSVLITMIFAGRIKERIPQPPLEKKVQINFWDGMFGVMRNKYKWVTTVVNLIDALGNGMLPFVTVLYLYTFRLTGLLYSLLFVLVSFAGTPPDFFAPYFLKRFTYKQIMIFYQVSRAIGNTIIVLAFLFFGNQVTLCGTISVIALILMEMTKTIPTTAGHDMDIRINDYQMYLSGERLENFSGVFGWFTGPITSFVGLIIPIMLLKYGFNSNWDVLFVDSSRIKIIVIPIIIDIVGYLLMTIPYFFWDYDDKKQAQVMEILKAREEATHGSLDGSVGDPGEDARPDDEATAAITAEDTAKPWDTDDPNDIWHRKIDGLKAPLIGKRVSNFKKKRIAVVLILTVAIGLSIFFSVLALHNNTFDFDKTSDGWELVKFSNPGDITELTLDYANGNENKPITSIHEYAFNCDDRLITVTIGKDVKEIDGKSFYSVWNLQNIFVDDENEYFCDIDGVLYNKDMTEIICYPVDHDKYLRKVHGYDNLKDDDGKDMEELWGPTGTYDEAFYEEYNRKVRTYVLPSTVTTIGEMALNYANLVDIYLPEGLTRIETLAMFKSTSLHGIYSYTCDEENLDTSAEAIGTFSSVYRSLPEGLESIGSDAFSYDQALDYLYLPASLKKIGHHAFWETWYKDGGIREINAALTEDAFDDQVEQGDHWRPQYDYHLFKKSLAVNYGAQRAE
ncbi:MAG: leucine-rich repeat protein [Clostridia bacterium]|nr:leucine-rich repeat protein [Clostridia bacterium]